MDEMTLALAPGQPPVSIRFRLNPRARRYILRLSRAGEPVVTVPRYGTLIEARAFAERNAGWLEKQLQRHRARKPSDRSWKIGTEILFRGERVAIHAEWDGARSQLFLGDLRIGPHPADDVDLRPAVQTFLWRLACAELPARLIEINAGLGLPVRRISVRNQRSRWGSCSRRGTISLNWRLVQTPAFVRDYIILHELAHLRHMNHSDAFWREVARLCQEYEAAERWLKANSSMLRR